MNRQEIIDSWNAQADEYNQWDDLGEDEKLDWAMQMEREACAQLCDHLWESKAAGAYECATAIRARGQQ